MQVGTLHFTSNEIFSYAIAEIFNRVIDTKLVQSSIDQLAAVVLARASYERRRLEADSEGLYFMVFTILSL